jgi:hypothetical protein
MLSEIRVPKLGMTEADITIVKLTKTDGETVENDETIAIIETAKVTYDLKAPSSKDWFWTIRTPGLHSWICSSKFWLPH